MWKMEEMAKNSRKMAALRLTKTQAKINRRWPEQKQHKRQLHQSIKSKKSSFSHKSIKAKTSTVLWKAGP